MERDPGQEESPAPATGCKHHSQVHKAMSSRWRLAALKLLELFHLMSFYSSQLHRFVKGFIYRHKERCPENEYFLDYVRYSFLMTLHRNLPKNVLDKSWPTPPAALKEVWRKHTHAHQQTHSRGSEDTG